MPSRLPVTFFYPYPDELATLEQYDLTDPDFSEYSFYSHEGSARRRGWILQTYFWLRREGYDVSISDTLPPEGVVVVLPEPDARSAFLDQYKRRHRSLFILTIRADIFGFRPSIGDGDIVQNGRFADEERTFFIPHWPQPGLLPRDPTRGRRIENVVFKGGYGSLDARYRSTRWANFLDSRGLQFHLASAETEGPVPTWRDYRTADLNLAVRPPFNDGGLRYEKPATKLVNAWHAGVPSLLGKEFAYRELRQSDLDYIEVESLDDAMAAIDRLLENRDRFVEMIEHGQERARQFTRPRIAERWAEVLFERVPQIASSQAFKLSRWLPLPLRRASNLATMPPSPFELRKRIGYAARRLPSPSWDQTA